MDEPMNLTDLISAIVRVIGDDNARRVSIDTPVLQEVVRQLSRARKVVRPFAERAARHDVDADSCDIGVWDEPTGITVGDLRRARAFMGEGE